MREKEGVSNFIKLNKDVNKLFQCCTQVHDICKIFKARSKMIKVK